MSVSPCPFVKFHAHDDNSNPATGWKIYSYTAGTDTPYPVFKDASGTTEHPNPLTLNSRGEPDGDGLFLEDGYAYKLVLKRPDGSTAWSVPYVMQNGSGGSEGGLEPIPGRTLLGNVGSETATPSSVQIASEVDENANAIPSALAVFQALADLLNGVVKTSGAQEINGSLDVTGNIDADSLSIAGADLSSLFVSQSGHAVNSLVGSLDGTTEDIALVDEVTEATSGQSVASVAALRLLIAASETGLVKISGGDTLGYLPDKVVGDGSSIVVQVVDNKLRISLDGESVGKAKPSIGGSLSYINDIFTQGEHVTLTKTDAGVEIAVPELTDVLFDIANLEAADVSLDARIDALESAVREKAVLFGGALGATSVVIPHGLGTSDLCVSCYDTVANQLIYLNVTVTSSSVSITDLAPLAADNQIKVVLVK